MSWLRYTQTYPALGIFTCLLNAVVNNNLHALQTMCHSQDSTCSILPSEIWGIKISLLSSQLHTRDKSPTIVTGRKAGIYFKFEMWSFTGEDSKAESPRLNMLFKCVMWHISHFTKHVIKLSALMFRVNLRCHLKKFTSCSCSPEWWVGSGRFHRFEWWLTAPVSIIGDIHFVYYLWCHSGSKCEFLSAIP